jgi:hypothetical protein
MIKVVVLVLTTWNTWTGEKLYELKMDWDRFSVNAIEECRRYGVREAHRLSEKYGVHASTNVDCHWEKRPGVPA